MTQPTDKNESIEQELQSLVIGGGDRRVAIKANVCFVGMGGCGKAVTDSDFETEIERREYKISGLCPACQRIIFASFDEEA